MVKAFYLNFYLYHILSLSLLGGFTRREASFSDFVCDEFKKYIYSNLGEHFLEKEIDR